MKVIRTSPHCQPQVRMGRRRMWPANMSDGSDRIAYLNGLLDYIALLSRSLTDEAVLDCIHRIPFAREVLQVNEESGRLIAVLRREVLDDVTFRAERLGIAIPDGRNRTEQNTAFLNTGPATANYGWVFCELQRGRAESDLQQISRQNDIDFDHLTSALGKRSLIEEVEADECCVAERFLSPSGDQLTWLGHAAAMVQSRITTIWIDPYLTPRVAWGPQDREALFSSEFADARLFERYGCDMPHYAIAELPAPDAVLITHQDCDHLDLGVLMTIPERTPIVVPKHSPDRPWDVDLPLLISQTLGPSRNVVSLEHGRLLQVKDITVTAFPFHGEMPTCLPHLWNCYLLTTDHSAVAFAADSRLDAENIEFLVGAMRNANVPLTLCAGAPSAVSMMPGWREGLTSTHLWANGRLWGWYIPPANLFDPTPCSDVSYDQLNDLARRAGLKYFFPYARGSTPWFRISDPNDAFYLPVGSMTAADLDAVEKELRSLPSSVRLFPGKYGIPTPLNE
jgi:L-ascorbate metabolism protein UlaG (beta-lactamase superfamily)